MCKRNRCEDCIFHIIENGKDKCDFFVPGDGFYIGDTHYFIPNDVTIFDRLFCRHIQKKARSKNEMSSFIKLHDKDDSTELAIRAESETEE